MGGYKYRVKKVSMDLHKRKVEGYKLQLVNDSIIAEEEVVAMRHGQPAFQRA